MSERVPEGMPPELEEFLQPILVINENPTNSVVVSPDGRIFVDALPVIIEMTMDLMRNTIMTQAEPESQEKDLKMSFLGGQRDALAALMKTLRLLQDRAMSEKLAREGLDKPFPE